MQPPVIIQFNASNVPVAQLTVSSKTLPEQTLFDYGLNFIRVRLFIIPGLSTPAPFGGKNRQIMVEIDPAALASRGVSPSDVVTAVFRILMSFFRPEQPAWATSTTVYSTNASPLVLGSLQHHTCKSSEQPAGLSARCGARFGQFCRTEQYCHRKRKVSHVSGHFEACRRLHPCGCRGNERSPAIYQRDCSRRAGTEVTSISQFLSGQPLGGSFVRPSWPRSWFRQKTSP